MANDSATGTLHSSLPESWRAQLIVAAPAADALAPERPVCFRRAFGIDRPVVEAALYVTACGVFEAEINGRVVGDHVLSPGWTSYRHRHRLLKHDVTSLLAAGANAIGITVGEGWYRGGLGFVLRRDNYGSQIGPIAQLQLRFADGTTETIVTDASWRSRPSAILSASLYDGETFDAGAHDPAWSTASFDDSSWDQVRVADFEASVLFVPDSPPVRRMEELAPASIERLVEGRYRIDFGQNASARLRINVPAAPPGSRITLRHAEVLENGELGTRPLRLAKATDTLICGDQPVTWEPKFTMHGFRYAEIDGWPGELRAGDVRAVVCHTDMREIGTFACSNAMLNQLHSNTRWSMKSNFVDVPTDCPQRNERLGWTGDIQVFSPVASFLYDSREMLESWLDDVAAEQRQYGSVPSWVPYLEIGFPPIPTAAWGDAAVIVPWVLYEHFGDEAILRRHYPMMQIWVDQIAQLAGPSHLWNRGFQFGDWLDPTAPPEHPAKARTDAGIVATAYHARTAAILAESARILGLDADAAKYAALAADVRAAFQREYVTASGRMASDAQTAFALALCFDLLANDEQRTRARDRLRKLVRREGYRVGTGFVGTPLICDALADAGDPDDAYLLLLQTECPSWLYAVTMGATTIWERWDSMLPDGSINPGEMTSFNHYAFGAVADFLHRRVAGLAPATPGYRTLAVRPLPGGGLTWAEASREVAGGTARVRWDRDGAMFRLQLDVPAGHDADVTMPDGSEPHRVGAGTHTLECAFRPADADPVEAPPPSGI